jgi:rod shape-determining protein MreC
MVVYRRETRRRSILVAVVLSSLILITLSSTGNGAVDTVRDAVRDVFAPIQDAVSSVTDPVENFFDDVGQAGSLRAENQRLKHEIAQLRSHAQQIEADRKQLAELEKIADLTDIADFKGIPARVVGGAPSDFERTIELDKGTSSGINIGMAVITGEGVVGKITDASSHRATVALIDGGNGPGVAVRLEGTLVQGVTRGRDGDSLLRLEFLQDPHVEIKPGSHPLVFVSPQDDIFPPNWPVARVVSVTRGSVGPKVTLQPVVDLNNVTLVKVLPPPGP